MSAVDYLLTIKGVEGESKDAAHRGAINVESWSWGASNVGTMQEGGGVVVAVKRGIGGVVESPRGGRHPADARTLERTADEHGRTGSGSRL